MTVTILSHASASAWAMSIGWRGEETEAGERCHVSCEPRRPRPRRALTPKAQCIHQTAASSNVASRAVVANLSSFSLSKRGESSSCHHHHRPGCLVDRLRGGIEPRLATRSCLGASALSRAAACRCQRVGLLVSHNCSSQTDTSVLATLLLASCV